MTNRSNIPKEIEIPPRKPKAPKKINYEEVEKAAKTAKTATNPITTLPLKIPGATDCGSTGSGGDTSGSAGLGFTLGAGGGQRIAPLCGTVTERVISSSKLSLKASASPRCLINFLKYFYMNLYKFI